MPMIPKGNKLTISYILGGSYMFDRSEVLCMGVSLQTFHTEEVGEVYLKTLPRNEKPSASGFLGFLVGEELLEIDVESRTELSLGTTMGAQFQVNPRVMSQLTPATYQGDGK